MGIFSILFRNTGRASRTLTPAAQAIPESYRGALLHDSALCTACGACAYVCSPGAISLDRSPDCAEWHYQAARCTHCARCVEFCPTGALGMQAAAPNTALLPSNARAEHHIVSYQPCPRCGAPVLPIPVEALERHTGRPVAGDLQDMLRLCEKCRARVTSQRMKESLRGELRASKR